MTNIGLIPAKWAALKPAAPAIYDVPHDVRITWRDLDRRVRCLANGLRSLGLQAGDRVAVLSRNSVEYQELYYAAGRAGLVAQPLSWRLAAPELARIIANGQPKALVTAGEFADVLADLQRLVDIPHWLQYGKGGDGTYEALLLGSSDEEPPWSSQVGDHDPFFILYTGGTTGESKGALHSHHSVAMGMLNQTVAERIVPTDVYMLTGQMYHIPVVLSMNYLRHGCPLVLVNFEARQALEIIESERVSAFLGITTMLNWMMAVEGFSGYDLSSLRNIQYGGGPMPSQTGRAALDGMTSGEIVVRSEANMLGYWGRPDLTATTLRDGWMWTGDIAVWDEQRYVYIVDRAKDMIISGGENIYSVQVEEAIGHHPAVLECAVIGVPDNEWGESVKAVVVLKPGTSATEQAVIDEARRHLASYQKPRSVDFVAALPKAPTGKILKRELRAPYWADRDRQV